MLLKFSEKENLKFLFVFKKYVLALAFASATCLGTAKFSLALSSPAAMALTRSRLASSAAYKIQRKTNNFFEICQQIYYET